MFDNKLVRMFRSLKLRLRRKTPIQEAFAAITTNDIVTFRKVLARTSQLLREEGVALLNYAAEYNSVDTLRLLLDAGIDPNAPETFHTPLGAAAAHGAIAASSLLLERGAQIDGRPKEKGTTPLHWAITGGHLSMVRWLLERGADPSITDGHPPQNALAAAKFWGRDEIAAYLAAQGIPEVVHEPEPVDVEAPAFFDFVEDAQEWFEGKFQHVCLRVESSGLNSVGQRNRVFFLVGYLINEIWDGGTENVFFNPSGRHVCQMVEGLRTIGASREADLLDEINQAFPDGQPARADDVRARQMSKMSAATVRIGQQFEALVAKGDVLEKLHFYWYSSPEQNHG